MQLQPIKVQCYAGYKADETPSRIFIYDEWLDVVDVVDRWYQTRLDPEWPLADYFKVICNNNIIYLIKHDIESDEWYFLKSWEANQSF
jgi:hypothetical protein